MKKMLKKLVEASGISGRESNIRDLMKKEFAKYCDTVKVDKIGNLIGKKGSGKIKVMLTAHMDALGLMVKNISEKGFIYFEPVGGWDQRVLLAQKVRIYTDSGIVMGIIGSKPIHIQEKEEREQAVKMKKLYIDIGAKDRDDAKKIGVKIGDAINLCGEFSELKNNLVSGCSFDDRAGCAALIEVLKTVNPKDYTLFAVGTVQEEIGLVGVRGSAFETDPDIVFVMDTTSAGDVPEVEENDAPAKTGLGPVIAVKDAASIINERVKDFLIKTAEKNKIPYQLEVLTGGATDAAVMPLVREGKPSACIAIPTRYGHTPVEVINMSDLENVVKLTLSVLDNIKNL